MSFLKGNKDSKHYWLTPPDLYERLNQEFDFDFDPCPYPLPDNFDGLLCEWGKSNYVNPPFSSIIQDGKKKGPTAWAKKAIEESKKGKQIVMVYPVDKWILMLLEHCVEVRNLLDVKWHSIEDNLPGKGIGRHIGCFILGKNINKNK
jgi:DNA N-6-adenine-methyltransferase (Dam)